MPILALGLISLLFYFLHGVDGDENMPVLAASTEGVAAINEIIVTDQDGDGLADWEESLWGSNPNAADTDGDGTTDGEEIDRKRNPAVAGPNDGNFESPQFAGAISTSTIPEYGLTSEAAQQLFTGYLLLKQSNNLNPQTTQDLVKTVISDAQAKTEQSGHILNELTVIDTSEPGALLTYQQSLKNIIDKSGTIPENEFIVMQRLMENPTPEDVAALEAASEVYAEIADELLKLPTPLAVQTQHLELVNGFRDFSTMTEIMGSYRSDPITAVIHIQRYITLSDTLQETSRKISSYVQNQQKP